MGVVDITCHPLLESICVSGNYVELFRASQWCPECSVVRLGLVSWRLGAVIWERQGKTFVHEGEVGVDR